MTNDSIKLCVVQNTPEGREKINSLRRGLKGTPFRLTLYGRYTGKRQLAERLRQENHPSYVTFKGPFSVESIVWMLRGRVPLPLSQRIAVYLRPRPTKVWRKVDGQDTLVSTKWDNLTK